MSNPQVQTLSSRLAAAWLTQKVGVEVHIAEINLSYRGAFLLQDLNIKDEYGKKMLDVGRFEFRISSINQRKRIITLGLLELKNVEFHLHKHQEDELSNMAHFLQYFEAKSQDTSAFSTTGKPWKINCKRLEIANADFSYINDILKLAESPGIDFNNAELTGIFASVKDFSINQDTILANIKQLEFSEKSGFELMQFSGDARFSPVALAVNQLKARTNNSYLDLDLLLEYENMAAFNDFISQVKMEGVFRPTVLNMSDIGYFAPTMFSMKDIINISGNVSGTVDNLKGEHLDISYGANTGFKGTIEMAGLPDIYTTFISAEIIQLSTNASDINSFVLPGDAGVVPVPDLLKTAGVVNISGTYTGFYNSFISRVQIKSRLGTVNADLTVRTTGAHNDIAYSGKLKAQQLDIGKLFGVEKSLGKTSFYLNVDGKGITLQTIDMTAKGAVNSLNFMGYDYKNISIDGNFKQAHFEGLLAMKDDNLDFDFNGLVDFNEANPVFNFTSDIRHADLFNLKLSNRDSISALATHLDINFTGGKLDSITGQVRFDKTSYIERNQFYTLDSLIISTSTAQDGVRQLYLHSDIVDAGFQGRFHFSTLPGVIANYIRNYSDILPQKIESEKTDGYPHVIDFWVDLKHTEQLTQLFLPAVNLAPNAKVNGLFHSGDNKFDMEFCADFVNLPAINFHDGRIVTSSDENYFYLDVTAQKALFSEPTEETPSGIGIDSLKFITQFRADSLHYVLTWQDLLGLGKNSGDILGNLVLEDQNHFKNHFSHLDVLIDGLQWNIVQDNEVGFENGKVEFHNVDFFSDSSRFQIAGAVSESVTDSLYLSFRDISINNVDQLLNQQDIDIDGVLNGNATITGLNDTPNFILDINIDKLFLNEEKLGFLDLFTSWNDAERALWVDLEIMKRGNVGIGRVLSLNGNYYPTRTDKNFDFDAQLTNLGIQLFNPFISEIAKISRESLASGTIKIAGTYAEPVFEGQLKLMRTQFLINYLNTYYTLAGTVDIKKNAISLNNLTLNDSKGKTASCYGSITHNFFRDFALDISISHDNFRVLNTTSRDNVLFFGDAFASGIFTMKGPIDDLLMSIIASTESGTQIKIPISSSLSVSENDFIIFLNTAEEEKEKEKSYNVNLKGLEIYLDLDVTQDAEIEIFLPNDIGKIEGVGEGNMVLNVDKRGDFFMYGDYEISDGIFRFTFENLIGRDFTIRQGSKISWAGDPYDATVDIQAIHSVKTSLAGLQFQTDSSAIYNTRVEVLCIINLQNDLFNPDIRFSMDFVNVPEDTKEIIYAALDTTNQSVMSQQILSLLLLNSFSYTSNAPNIGATSFKLISNQLSNMLSKLSKDFDIGINYQPGSQLTEEELEVVLRTQLFNDRLLIDGNFGVKGSSPNQNTSSVLGDINVEYKMTKDGRFRVKAFNRTNNLSFFYDNAPYTQGIGLFYRREFDRINDLLGRSAKSGKSAGEPEKKENETPNSEAVLESSRRHDE